MTQTTLSQETWHEHQQLSLLDLLDRLLDKGVVADGEILLTVADIDLVYVGLKCILSSVETLRENAPESEKVERFTPLQRFSKSSRAESGERNKAANEISSSVSEKLAPDNVQLDSPAERLTREEDVSEGPSFFESVEPAKAPQGAEPRSKIKVDSEKVEKGLVKLVLTVVELLRKLMEKQAIRRMEGGSLGKRKVEELGTAFLRLDEKMEELKRFFGLKDEDLNLNLGPLGRVI